MSRVLDVYLSDIYAGELIQNDSGMLCFTYDASYLDNNHPALSISLPLFPASYKGEVVKAFFSGLLPEDIVRHRLAKYLGLSEKNPFSLLEEVGGECAGALSLYPQGTKPSKPTKHDFEILDDKKLTEILDLLRRRPLLAGDGGLRLSLAGAQDKMAVGVIDNQIALIKGSSPTTHILKPVIENVTDSVHNEFFCMRLADLVGIQTPKVQIGHLNETPYFLIERYDRIKKDGHVQRIHQEDFCQALAVMPEMKYEREGGIGIRQCQDLINNHSASPALDQVNFLKRIMFNFIIGNADAHSKNFSFLYKGPKPQLSPAYDLLSTIIYPDLSKKMAMKIGSKYKYEDVCLRHWYQLASNTSTAKKNLEKELKKMASNCLDHSYDLKNLLQKEGISSVVFDDICSIISKRAGRICS